MVKPTHDEIIRGLTRDMAVLQERLEFVRGETGGIADLAIRLALLEQQVQNARQGWERWAQRIWMILAPIVGGAVGALLTYYLNAKR